jgi:hypothetical protein
MALRAGLDDLKMRKIFFLPGFKPQTVAYSTSDSGSYRVEVELPIFLLATYSKWM